MVNFYPIIFQFKIFKHNAWLSLWNIFAYFSYISHLTRVMHIDVNNSRQPHQTKQPATIISAKPTEFE